MISFFTHMNTKRFQWRLLICQGFLVLGLARAGAVDWPMWRADAGHTAVSEERLAESLHLQWILTFSERERVWDDPLNHDLMQYDKILEPIVMDERMFVSFSGEDKVAAFDLQTGQEVWAFYADGPVRFAPVGWKGWLYVCSDDGYLYCLDAAEGSLVWKFQGAPSDRKVLGNGRVISAWPARGGPVIRDGMIYFAASIWPFMGTFIYSLDARSGAVEWVNDGTGADYIKQPHSAPSFGGVAPQGTLVAMEDHLLVPGGRSVPAALDRGTGELIHFRLNDGGKANGGSFVIGQGDHFYVHTRLRGVRAYDVKNGDKKGFVVNEPVLAEEVLYTAAEQPVLKVHLAAAEKEVRDAVAEWKKADKQLASAIADKERPLTEPQKKVEDAEKGVSKAERAVEELKISLESEDSFLKEAVKKLEEAKKTLSESKKKLEGARKKKKDPVDPKLFENLAKREAALCEKDFDHQALKQEWETVGRDVPVLQAYNGKAELQWEFAADGLGDLILAGQRLYAAGREEIVAVEHPGDSARARVSWRQSVDGEVLRLLAANGKLITVTLDGRIFCYGSERTRNPRKPPKRVLADQSWPFSQPADNRLARQVLALADVDEGYALCFGVDDGRMLESFAEESRLHMVAVEPDEEVVQGLREKYDYMGLYGKRIVLQKSDPQGYQAPPYIFNLVILGDETASKLHDPSTIKLIFESVRPYGGALWFRSNPALVERIEALGMPGAEVTRGPGGSVYVFRQGPLPESSDWTHQYGDMANTVKSDDKLVKLPLGVLWFGGAPNTDVLPRHGHGPSEQVVGGRTIIEGMDCLSARDVYTGRILWKREFENLGTYGVYYDHTYTDDPLNPAYNQVHIPGANARGTNYVATEDSVYVAIGNACHVLDAATGQDVKIFEVPNPDERTPPPSWAFIGVEGDLLLAGNDFARYTSRYGLDRKKNEGKDAEDNRDRRGRKRKRAASEEPPKKEAVPAIEDLSASQGLIAYDRHSGEIRWKVDAEFSFLHNGIVSGGGKLYLLDKFPKSMEDKLKRRGLAKPEDYRIVAIDANSGEQVWEHRGGIFGTWLSYSAKHDILLEAGAKGRDRLKDEVGEGLTTYQGISGEILWKKEKLAYAGPCILHNDLILTAPDQYADSAGAYHLVDGSPYLITNPLTGKEEPWRITRAYGCNTPVAGEHLLTFRSGAAGYYDLDNMSGTGNFGGFKSGCTSNLIPANGVLNAPDYTRTCSCGYQNQTSLAMVHMPDVELWTYNRYGVDADSHEEIRRVGINFGAPGDRRSEDGTLWLEAPSVGGDSPEVTVSLEGMEGRKVDTFRRHSSQVRTTRSLGWVGASGMRHVSRVTITPTMRFQAQNSQDTITAGIATSEDDAEEAPSGTVRLTSSDLELVHDGADQLVSLRFTDLPLFPGEKIKKASIQFTVDEPKAVVSGEDGKAIETILSIHVENSANARPFDTSAGDLSRRPFLGDKGIEWKPKAWAKADDHGGDQQTPDLAALVQAVVDRDDWAFGQAMAFFIQGQGKRVAHAFDKDPKKAPRLVVEVESGAPRVRVAAKEDDAEERADGSVSLDSGDLELTADPDQDGSQRVGIRFRGLQIPRGQRLDEVYLQFICDEPSGEDADLIITVEDAVNPPPFKREKRHLSGRKLMEESLRWRPGEWRAKDERGSAQRTPNLAPLLQPLIDREDWEPGNAMVFMITGEGHRGAISFDGKKEQAPALLVNYPSSPQELDLAEAPRYTVRLHFFDPDGLPQGRRMGDVRLQGKVVLEDFDISAHRKDADHVVVKEFRGIPVPHHLDIEFAAPEGGEETPVLSGVELIREEGEADVRRASVRATGE